jgi:thiol-disulfide isomerase/thioredoxin
MPDAPPASRPWLVACLCAQWCGTCRDYRPVFEALTREFGDRALCVWVDIEDDAAVMGHADVEDFPTLLIARHEDVCFFGPVTPHAATARRLVQSALDGELPVRRDDELDGLPGRVRALAR